MTDPRDDLSWIAPLIQGTGKGHSPETLDDLTAAVLLTAGVPLTELPPPLLAVLLGFARRAGLDPGAGREGMLEQVRAYFAAHPLPPALVLGVERELERMSAAGDPRALHGRFARFRADGPAGEPPPGEAAGRGALGFFAAHAKLKK